MNSKKPKEADTNYKVKVYMKTCQELTYKIEKTSTKLIKLFIIITIKYNRRRMIL